MGVRVSGLGVWGLGFGVWGLQCHNVGLAVFRKRFGLHGDAAAATARELATSCFQGRGFRLGFGFMLWFGV